MARTARLAVTRQIIRCMHAPSYGMCIYRWHGASVCASRRSLHTSSYVLLRRVACGSNIYTYYYARVMYIYILHGVHNRCIVRIHTGVCGSYILASVWMDSGMHAAVS